MAARAARTAAITEVFNVLRAALATLSTYLLVYPLTFLVVCITSAALMLGLRGFLPVAVAAWARLPFWLVGRRLHLIGGNLVDPARRYLVVANHASMYDVPALVAVLPGMAIMGREYLTRIPLFGYLLRAARYIPVDTGSLRKAAEAVRAAIRRSHEGLSVGMFPEGTRTRDGNVQPLRPGFLRIMRDGKFDLLPVRIDGTWTLKPRHHWYMDPRERIEVTVRTPIAQERIARLSDHEIVERVRHSIARLGEEPA
jgi:1-acyl-sn-glycerol-3-phosphate acyltransferase